MWREVCSWPAGWRRSISTLGFSRRYIKYRAANAGDEKLVGCFFFFFIVSARLFSYKPCCSFRQYRRLHGQARTAVKPSKFSRTGSLQRINLCHRLLTRNDPLSSSTLNCLHICFNSAVHLGGYASRSGEFQHKITGVNGKVSPLPWIESDRLSAWGRGPIFSPKQFSRLGRLYRKLWIAPGASRAEWAIPDSNVSKLSPPSKGGRAWYHSALCANHLKDTKKYHARSTT